MSDLHFFTRCVFQLLGLVYEVPRVPLALSKSKLVGGLKRFLFRNGVRCTYQATALGSRGPYGTAPAAHVAARDLPACIDTPDRVLAI